MTLTQTQEAPRSHLSFHDDAPLNIDQMVEAAQDALAPFGLIDDTIDTRFDAAQITAGPIEITLAIIDSADGTGSDIAVTVTMRRASEALHPETDTAVLAEIMSILIERTGGTTLTWGADQITLPAARFQAAFKPMRLRAPDELPRITPRRVRPAGAPEPQVIDVAAPSAPATPPEPLETIFRQDMITDQQDAPAPAARAATLAATAGVTVMNPMIGLPVAAYQAVRGGDIRVATHAFALTAILTGATPSMAGLLAFL